jgi:molybdate transport system substrate-binding protein
VIRRALPFLLAALAMPAAAQAAGGKVFAAGSLKESFTAAAAAFSAYRAGAVTFEFGPSGTLKDRILRGEPGDVFASANMDHPRAVYQAGKAGPVRMFARNRLCALAPAKLGVTTANVLDRMLDPSVKLGTSTPKADPSGDYAWQVFERAEKLKHGAYEVLSHKALKLVGGPNTAPSPEGRTAYAMLVAGGKANIFLTYCTNATLAVKEEPSLAIIALPEALEVGADYGVVALEGASPTGNAFIEFLLGDEGQRILREAGFSSPAR